MEDNFRNVLIILSGIVITAIFIHGLWTIRKQKNPYKLKTSKNKVDPILRDFDRKGFDQDGVGEVKVSKGPLSSENYGQETPDLVKDRHNNAAFTPTQSIRQSDTLGETPDLYSTTSQDTDDGLITDLDNSLDNDWLKYDAKTDVLQDSRQSFTKDELGDALTPSTNASIEPLYKQPVTQAKPIRTPINKVKNTLPKAELKRDQVEIDVEHQNNVQSSKPKEAITPLEPEVIILSVVMPTSQQMLGAALLPSLLTLGLKYGDMNIFHRHEDNAGNGKVTFSLANIMNPGSFDLDSMETFATRGVSLFMTLPNAGDSFSVFEQMLSAAKQLAQEFDAQLLDDKRNIMTKKTEQHYVTKIREFDRKRRITLA